MGAFSLIFTDFFIIFVSNTMKRGFKILLGSFCAFCILIIVSLSLEIFLRAKGKYPVNGQVYDNATLWKTRPNMASQSKSEEFGAFALETDNYGFRNMHKVYTPDKSKLRILVIGDSYTAALYLPYERMFTYLLEKGLENTTAVNKSIEVYNMASPGWGVEQQYQCLIKYGLQIKPDYVFIMTCPNDIREAYCKKYAQLKDGHLDFNQPPFSKSQLLRWKLSNYSNFYQYLQHSWFHTDYGSVDYLMTKMRFNFGKEDTTDWDRPLFMKHPIREVTEAWNLYFVTALKMKESCDLLHVKISFSCIPVLSEFDGSMQRDTLLTPGIVAAKIDSFCRAQHMDYVDLHTPFTMDTTPRNLFRSNGDFHWNSRGASLAAEVLKRYYLTELTKQ